MKSVNLRSVGALAAVAGGVLWVVEGLRYLTSTEPILNWGSTFVGIVVTGFGLLVALVGLWLLLRDFSDTEK